MRQPVVNVEGSARGLEVAVVKGKEVLVVVVEALQSVCFSLREIPDITNVEDLILVTSEFIDGRDCDASFGDVSPFGL